MGGMLMGALGGLGQGLANQSARLAEVEMKRDLAEMQRQIEIEREKRTEEAQVRSEGRQESAQIRQEQRQAENRKAQQQSDLEFSTNPDNVRKFTEAELVKKKAEDAYSDSRSGIEIEQAAKKAGAIDRATYHDVTDYEGRNLSHEAAQLAIQEKRDELSGVRMTKADEKKYDFLKEQYKELAKSKADAMDDEARIGYEDDMDAVASKINALLSKYDVDGEDAQQHADEDPLGIKRDAKVKAIMALNPKAALDDNLSLAQLDEILKMEQGAAQERKNKAKPTGLLQSGASGQW
jgi:hypothetical protein